MPPPLAPSIPMMRRGPTSRVRVAVDGTPLLGVRTGVGHTVAAMLDALKPHTELDLHVYAVTWRGRRELVASVGSGARIAVRPIPARAVQAAWRHMSTPRIERWTGPVDVVHGTNFVGPPARVPVLVTIHDLTFALRPELAAPNHYLELIRRALDRGATVHAVSEHVATQTREVFGLSADRVVCIHPGLLVTGTGDSTRGRRRAGGDRYVLFLGELGPRKNVERLVQAFDLAAGDDPDLHLVLAGPDGSSTASVARAIEAAAHRSRIRRLGYVSASERLDLLAGASVFAFPSLDEGFGHPPLEAMRAGVPVVAADAGALPEVLGDAALLVAPTDVDALADALADALTPQVGVDLVARGRMQAQRYGWDRAAEQLVTLYQRLAG
jgi:glycosyltransferase involved in cell wall biosynthesis